jgi:hypothetical protein
MEALLGFEIDIWDYLTFLTLMVCVVALIMTWLFLAGLPDGLPSPVSTPRPKRSSTSVMRACCPRSTLGCRR